MISDRNLDLGTWDAGGLTGTATPYDSPFWVDLGALGAFRDMAPGSPLSVHVVVTEQLQGNTMSVLMQVVVADDDTGLGAEPIAQAFEEALTTHLVGSEFVAILSPQASGHPAATSGKRYLGMQYILTVTGAAIAGMLSARVVVASPANPKRHYRTGFQVF